MKTIAIRVTDDDHKLFVALADREDMPLSSLVRRQLRALARDHGLLQYPEEQPKQPAEPVNPNTVWRPIPQGHGVWAYEIHARRSAGESFADIATSYGVDVSIVKARYKYADENIANGELSPVQKDDTATSRPVHTIPSSVVQAISPVHTIEPEQPADTPPDDEPELVYDPVDPDNPTEEEQAAHAEIARRRMIALGFKL